MTDLSLADLSYANLPALQEALDRMGLAITLKEPTDAMLKRGWHCIDFDRERYREGQTTWDRPPPHQTSMKEDVRDTFVIMNQEAQEEISRRQRLAMRRTRTVRFQNVRSRSSSPQL